MPARKPQRVRARDQMVDHSADDPDAIERITAELARGVQRLEAMATRSGLQIDLVVGDNRVIHRLGRPPNGCAVTPTVADASFAWALSSKDANVATIAVVGVDQPGAWVEFY